MTVGELINQLRTRLNDTDKIEYTDQELINYINQAQDYISNIAVNNSFKGLLKTVDLTLVDGEATLPGDFVKEYSVISHTHILNSIPPDAEPDEYSYKIIGNELFSKNNTVSLIYFYYYPSYITVNEDIAVPQPFVNLLREIATYLALNRLEFNTSFEIQLSQLYEDRILQIINNYGNSNLERPMPFRV